jgi:superfamily II DNA or RNA helicase
VVNGGLMILNKKIVMCGYEDQWLQTSGPVILCFYKLKGLEQGFVSNAKKLGNYETSTFLFWMIVGYLTNPYNVTPMDIVASKDELVEFLKKNLTAEDLKLLPVSQLGLVQLRTHVAALLCTAPKCLSPYEELSQQKLLFLAVTNNIILPKKSLSRPKLIELLCTKVRKPLVLNEQGERLRQEQTLLCLAAVESAFGAIRYGEEANHFFEWALSDAAGHKDAKFLKKRVEWLKNQDRSDEEAMLRCHYIPVLENKPDLIPWKQATFENLEIGHALPAIGAPSSVNETGPKKSFFFLEEKWREEPGHFELRDPQREALRHVPKVETAAAFSAEEHYSLLSRLRSWFFGVLQQTYKGEVLAPETLARGEQYRKQMLALPKLEGASQPTMLVLPTGTGKTTVICLAPFVGNARRILVVVPNTILQEHMRGQFEEFYKWTGVQRRPRVTVKRTLVHADVFVLNVQKLQGDKLLHTFPSDFFDLVIFDEAHHAEAKTYRLIREHFQCAFLYVTATPFRGDGIVIDAKLAYSCTMASAIEKKYLKNVCYEPVPVKSANLVSKDGSKTAVSDISSMDEVYWACRVSKECKLVVMDYAMNRLRKIRAISSVKHQMIAQANDLEEAQELVSLWRKHSNNNGEFKVDYVGSSRPDNVRVLEDLIANRIDIIIHVGMLGEGFDHPLLSICVIFRRFGSFAPFAQFVGRAVRRIKGASDEDNCAYVIAHPGLGLAKHWDMYKRADEGLPDDSLLERSSPNLDWVDLVDHVLGVEEQDWFVSKVKEN